jgi:hypothetical protein
MGRNVGVGFFNGLLPRRVLRESGVTAALAADFTDGLNGQCPR